MTRSVLLLLAATGLVFAQNQPPSGGWRRVGEAPPPPQSPAASGPELQAQDPEPIERDSFGQPVQQQPQMQQQPQLQQRPPMARPSYGMPAEVTLRPGTYMTVRLAQTLSSDHNQPGDTFMASLAQPVVVDGIVVAQRNQMVYGRVAESEKSHSDRPSRLALQLTSMTLADGSQIPIRSMLVARKGTTTPAGDQVGTVAMTTGVGAMVGAAADWGRGAAIGAGVGAAAGIAGVLLTRNHPTIVYPESVLTFEVEAPATIVTARAPQAFRYVDSEDYTQAPVNAELHRRPVPAYPYYGAPYPSPYYYGGYGYPYYGGFSIAIGRGWGWGHGYYGHGRRW